MKSRKIKATVIFTIITILIAILVFNVYAEMHGFPWMHAKVKKEAVKYMKQKYNMDVIAIGSSFNFKFDYYSAEVYNAKDYEKSPIRVEMWEFRQEPNIRGVRLEDNYSMVYWESFMDKELRSRYKELYTHKEVESIKVDYAYCTASIDELVSTEMDKDGVYIPMEPRLSSMLDIDLSSIEISDDFLETLLSVIKDIADSNLKVDFNVTGRYLGDTEGVKNSSTAILNIEHMVLGQIESFEDLKLRVSEY